MKTASLQTTRLAHGQPPRPALLVANWNALVKQSVHAPVAAPSLTKTGTGKLSLPSNVSNYSGPSYVQGNVIGSNAGGGIAVGGGANLSKLARVNASTGALTSDPAVPNLWVEKGVIWQLPNLLVGFTSYSAATAFFSSVKGLGLAPAPSSWYEGTPFSATDFPMLQWGTAADDNCYLLIWPSFNTLPFAQTFLPMLPFSGYGPSPAPSAGPVVPTSAMGNFSANSPTGVQTFQAQYIMYAPWGPKPAGFQSTTATGINYDISMYGWIYVL